MTPTSIHTEDSNGNMDDSEYSPSETRTESDDSIIDNHNHNSSKKIILPGIERVLEYKVRLFYRIMMTLATCGIIIFFLNHMLMWKNLV